MEMELQVIRQSDYDWWERASIQTIGLTIVTYEWQILHHWTRVDVMGEYCAIAMCRAGYAQKTIDLFRKNYYVF